MAWRAQMNEHGVITRYIDSDSGRIISANEYSHLTQTQTTTTTTTSPVGQTSYSGLTGLNASPVQIDGKGKLVSTPVSQQTTTTSSMQSTSPVINANQSPAVVQSTTSSTTSSTTGNPLIQPGAHILNNQQAQLAEDTSMVSAGPPTAGQTVQGKNLRLEGIRRAVPYSTTTVARPAHGFLDATSIAILLPTLVLIALVLAAAHKKRLFPWQTIRTFNPPSGLLTPIEYERSYLCPPNLRKHGRFGKRNPSATWTEQDGVVIPFGFLARTHLPVTIPLGRLPNKNMFIVAPSGSGKTTLVRAVIKALLAKPCVIVALEAKANDPNLDEKREGFKYTVLPEAQQAGFATLYFNPLDIDSVHWNPLDLDPIIFASSIVQDVNSLPPEQQHWAERDHGYIAGLATMLKWGAVMVVGEDENGMAAEVRPLDCNPTGLMRLVNNRRNIAESLRRLKNNPDVDLAELAELTQTLSSIIRTETDWDKNIQGVRGRLRMFKNPHVLRVTEKSNIDMRSAMHKPTVLIFGAPASLGPDAESLAACFVYQLQQALHTRYGTVSVLPLFAFFDEYQTLNLDIAGRLSAIVRGANGGLAVILQNISQIAGRLSIDPTSPSGSELKTIFSNSAIRICLHNADESTAKFFSDEMGKHAIIVPGVSDHFMGSTFPKSWNKIYSQQVVPRVDPDSIKRMEKHHGLIFLSPAGDPEFGEMKPLMVDLRGIEEIARLHLMHNVTGRNVPPTAPPPIDGTQPPVSPDGTPGADGASRICPHCGQQAGKGRFCIECGRPIIPLTSSNTPKEGSNPEQTTPVVPLPSGVADVSQELIQSIFSPNKPSVETTPKAEEVLAQPVQSAQPQEQQSNWKATANVAMPEVVGAPKPLAQPVDFPPSFVKSNEKPAENVDPMQPMPGGQAAPSWESAWGAIPNQTEGTTPTQDEGKRTPVTSLFVDPNIFPGHLPGVQSQKEAPPGSVEF